MPGGKTGIDHRSERGEADAAGHEKQVPVRQVGHGKGTAIRPAQSDHIPLLHVMQGRGQDARPAHAQMNGAAIGRGGGNRDGRLAAMGRRHHHELAGLIGKRAIVRAVNKGKDKGLDLGIFYNYLSDLRPPGTIEILG